MNETTYLIVLMLAITAFFALVLKAFYDHQSPKSVLYIVAALLFSWFAFGYFVLQQDMFSALNMPRVAFASIVTFPVIVGVLAYNFWSTFRSTIDRMSTETFLSLQHMRTVFGILFFFTTALPLFFQLIGGLGDIAAGVGAFLALRSLKKGDLTTSAAIIRGNIAGVLDFIIVFTLALTIILKHEPAALGDMFNLIPVVVVPIFILLHIASLRLLKK